MNTSSFYCLTSKLLSIYKSILKSIFINEIALGFFLSMSSSNYDEINAFTN